ncbi:MULTISPECIES: UBP-type zinc finger domain-containing protein [Streptomyces]|uniref:UBP-type zinc finger domain-containing protein n=1 Tax=Streptomyces sp. NPDC007110 TaxID=3156916 RepID=UPI0031D927C7
MRCAARGRDERRLRICLTCGHVGCSDSAPGAHATAHFESSGHPLVRSAEPGRQWAWCYVDEVFLQPAP